MSNSVVPRGFHICRREVGTLHGYFTNRSMEDGILRKNFSNKLYKEIKKGSNEAAFYRLIKSNLDEQYQFLISDKNCPWPYADLDDLDIMASLTPHYFGTEEVGGKNYVVLIDVTTDYKHPAVMKVEIGELAPNAETLIGNKTREQLGFGIIGWLVEGNGLSVRKIYREQAEKGIQGALEKFFLGRAKTKESVKEVVGQTVEKLEHIRVYMGKQKSFVFCGSSLLISYENDLSRPANIQVFMIGFSHVLPAYAANADCYLHGLKNLIGFVKAAADL